MSSPVLVATDFSEYSARATRMGLQLAASLNAPLLMVHVVEPIQHTEADPDIEAFQQQLMLDGQKKMQAELARWHGEQHSACLIELGPRVPTLLRIIEEHKPLVVVMGSRLQDLKRVGISLEVLLQCPYPMLLVPHSVED